MQKFFLLQIAPVSEEGKYNMVKMSLNESEEDLYTRRSKLVAFVEKLREAYQEKSLTADEIDLLLKKMRSTLLELKAIDNVLHRLKKQR